MPAADRSLDIVAFVTEHFRDIMRRRLRELAGLALITIALLGAIALATWSVQDPSLSHATHKPIANLLGYPGAIFSDLATQLLGLGAVLLLAPEALLGWRLLAHQELGEKWRGLLWILTTLLAAAFASTLPVLSTWPLPTGLGGVFGDAILRVPAALAGGTLDGISALIASIVFGFATLFTLLAASGLRVFRKPGAAAEEADEDVEHDGEDDEEEADRASPWLGMIAHALLSLKARLMLVLRPSPRTKVAAPGARQEPRFGGLSRVAAPSMAPESDEDYEDGEEEEEAPAPRKRAAAVPKAPARKSGSGFALPSLNLLAAQKASERSQMPKDVIDANATALESVLQDFGVRGEIINARPGPVVTLYELEPAPGIKSSRVIGLADDIARSMSAVSARVAVVSGRNAIGIELPNPMREKVYLRELLAGKDYTETAVKLPLCLGKTIGGESVIVDLARMPHLLIAGTTGSGKSVAINTMILSLVYKLRPDQCRLIMVDPKMLELSVYDGIPHLLTPVVTDPKKAVVALKWAVREMEGRYKKMSKLGVRNIDGYNARVAEAKTKGEQLTRTVHTGYDKESGEAIYEKEELDLEPLPFIVVIVDEMADLMMVAGKDIEGAIQRLAQMARAAGIHVVLATQRPSVDVITGTIKANFPTRISFQVTSKIDSRTILGEQGAEQLLGQGDMLYMAGGGRISRVHGPFCSDDEVEKVVRHLKSQGMPDYLEEVTKDDDLEGEDGAVFDATGMGMAEGGDLYSQAVAVVKRDRKASTSYIQRRLQIGYNRAATLMERMENDGIVGQPNHAGKREILIPEEGDFER
ncbi:MAG TPA: DNA translocase FtsK 4TM domain-containing protein [Pseudolabrys sp.]|uniref:DNA translocase FtsK n=1 Tax=Pseudolabrys sp. TaxID=1960880 RepID=UPI002DDD673B|nr:DNA translocase FtsK 4TM domain-containing protein [Pseudolabrys sp.]HEV2628120.1 DNA translocase FtsK 4TM domain-containing protein [Pseudolabrys sp.]